MIGIALKQTKDLITDNKLNDFYRQLGKPIQTVKKSIDDGFNSIAPETVMKEQVLVYAYY